MKYLHRLSDFDSYYSKVTAGTLTDPCITLVNDENVFYKNLTTDISNPALMEIARNAGWVSSGATAMTYEDAYNVTNAQFNAANHVTTESGYPNGMNSPFKDLETFNEFKYFKQVTSTTWTVVDSENGTYEGGFLNATKLYSIEFPDTLRQLGQNAFFYCRLRKLEFPESYKGTTGKNNFAYNNYLTTVKFNYEMNVISDNAFYSPNGTCEFDIPDNNKITYIGNQAFCHGWSSTLKNTTLNLPRIRLYGYENFINQIGPRHIIFGPNLETLGAGSAYTGTYNDIFGSYIESITIDSECPNFKCVDGVVYSKDGTICYGGAEYGLSKRKTVTIAEGVTYLMSGAFRDLMHSLDGDESVVPWFDASEQILENLVLPSTLTQVGDRICQYSSRLQRVIIYATTPPTRVGGGVAAFLNPSKIYVPEASVSAYKSAWSNFSNKIYAITQDILNQL